MYTCINLTVSLTVTATQASVVSTATLEGCGRRGLSVHIYNVMQMIRLHYLDLHTASGAYRALDRTQRCRDKKRRLRTD